MNDQRLLAGIELGGTKAIAVLARGQHIIAQERVPTTDPSSTLGLLSSRLAGWEAEHGKPEALGIASFGPLQLDHANPAYGHITRTPKSGWSGCDVIGPFAERFDGPISLDTDVAGAALAEYLWGAARNCRVAVYLTIGTGVGGGVVVDGVPVHGATHPEIGHIRIRRGRNDGFAGSCSFHGDCVEGLIAGPAIAARTGQRGDLIASDHPVWANVVDELAELLAILVLTISPNRIMIGGGVVQDRPDLLSAAAATAARLLNDYSDGMTARDLERMVVPPGLGALAGPLGAIALAGTPFRSSPSTERRATPPDANNGI
jgi:fructokinase